MSKAALKLYRREIGDAWLPHVGRRRLTPHEYKLVEGWFNEGIPLHLILRAINDAAERARSSSNTIYSLGVIRADLVKQQRQWASVSVGLHSQQPAVDWRARYREDLEDIIEMEIDQSKIEPLRALLNDLLSLSKPDAESRLRAIYNEEPR